MRFDSQPIPAPLADLIARRFAVLAEPMRLRILDALRRAGESSVQELADAVEASHANVSKHLGVLHGAAIVSRRKLGNRALYEVADPGVFRLCEEVCGGLEEEIQRLEALLRG